MPVRHNEVAKALYNEMMKQFNYNHEPRKTPESIFKTAKVEVWWDKKISVQPPVEHNRPDIVLWDLEKKKCTVIDICVPLDVNVAREEKEKSDKYFLLTSRLQRLYPKFTYHIVPIVVGSTGFIPKSLYGHLQKCSIDKDRVYPTIRQLQRKALQGSVKIVKTALKM